MLSKQTAWFVSTGAGAAPANLLNKASGVGALTTGYTTTALGSAFNIDGTTSMDLGSGNVFISSGSTPYTISWIERVGASPPTFPGLLYLKIGGGAPTFSILRLSQDTADNTHYGRLAAGPNTTVGTPRWYCFLTVPRVSDSIGITRHFILTSTAGTSAQSTLLTCWVDGVLFGSTAGGFSPNLTTTQNKFGWDGVDSVWKGGLDNLRIWERSFTHQDARQLTLDPYLGARRRRIPFGTPSSPAVVADNRWFLMQ